MFDCWKLYWALFVNYWRKRDNQKLWEHQNQAFEQSTRQSYCQPGYWVTPITNCNFAIFSDSPNLLKTLSRTAIQLRYLYEILFCLLKNLPKAWILKYTGGQSLNLEPTFYLFLYSICDAIFDKLPELWQISCITPHQVEINTRRNFKVKGLFLRSFSQNIPNLTPVMTSLTQNWVKKSSNFYFMYKW